MPSDCGTDCACACQVTKIRGLKLSEEEYEKVKQVVDTLRKEEKDDKRREEVSNLRKEMSRLRANIKQNQRALNALKRKAEMLKLK